MNIIVGGFFHESNSFNPIVTPESDFIVFEGDEIYAGAKAYPLAGGILHYFAERPEYQVFPLVFARAVPNGEINTDFYNHLKARFFEMLSEVESVDAFVLAQHGSMRVKGIGSAEQDLLSDIRALFPETPIVCGLDMHATVTPRMLELANAYVGFKTAPHIDAFETGVQAAQMADRLLTDGIPLCMAVERLDYLIAGEKSETDCPPMRELMARAREMETEDDVCAVSLLLGFPWAEAEDNGVVAMAVTAGNPDKARRYVHEMAERFVASRKQFCFSSPACEPDEALRRALNETVRPVFVSDSGDNPTAGSTADNTTFPALLARLDDHELSGKRILMAGIFDPIAFSVCVKQMNTEIELEIGGKFDTMYCSPLRLWGTPVLLVKDFGNYHSGLILFRTRSFDLVITEKHIGFTGTAMFEALCIDFLNIDIIVVKLGYLTEEFRDIAAASYLALTRGCTDEVLERLHRSGRYTLI
jgi:microcystin degradation protein MlrC